MNKNRITLALLAIALHAAPALAFSDFTVKDIRIVGVERIEPGTIFSYLPVKVGDTMTDAKAPQAIKALYDTGFFDDVRLGVDHGVLVVQVVERPAIAKLDIVGAKDISADDIKNALKLGGIAEGRIYDKSQIEKAENEIKRQYFARGRYSVDIKLTVSPVSRNRVAVVFNIDEGDVAHIRRISFVGNHAFSDKELLKQLSLTTPGWFSRITRDDQYSKQKLAADMETLKSFYMDRGYLDFRIDSNQVGISAGRDAVELVYNITEGKRYTFGKVAVAGNTHVPTAELQKLITIKPGDVFNRSRLQAAVKDIGERLGNDGYAFANVQAVPDVDTAKNVAGFTLMVDPGRRVYVNRINIVGNNRTRDEVIRREMRQQEHAFYDSAKIKRSKERLERLGFFDNINIETAPVAGHPDLVDLNVSMAERPTGSLTLSAGFSSSDGLVLGGSVSQANIFGTGNQLSLAVNTGKVNRLTTLSYTNPYVTEDGVSRGFDLYQRNVNTDSLSGVEPYATSTLGAGVRYAIPMSETRSVNFGLAAEQIKVQTSTASPPQYIGFVQQQAGPDAFNSKSNVVKGTFGYSIDSRDSILYPTRGHYNRIYGEVGLPGGDLEYYKINYQHQWFIPLTEDIAFMLNGQAGYANGYHNKSLPFFDNFYVGGVDTVRGYRTSSLGNTDANGLAEGGNREVIGNAEVFMPLPGLKDKHTARLSAFVDSGYVWQPGQPVLASDLRYSAGVALTWISPLGPLKFSLAQPLNAKPTDHVERFQFTMGTTF